MKILIISTVPVDKNGITNVIFNYFRAINSSEIDFDFVSINNPNDNYVNEIEARGGKLFVLKRSNTRLIHYIKQLSKIIKNGKYNAVHIHGNSHTVVFELIAAKLGGCKNRIVHAHSTSCNSILLHKVLTIPFNILCNKRIACGKMAGFFMFGGKQFHILNNGIDTEKYSFREDIRLLWRKKLGYRNDDVVLGHVGYFSEVKNQKYIIEILNVIVEAHSDYKLLLVGDGIQRKEIMDQVDKYELGNNVLFTGNIDNVSDYLNCMDVIVMPSLYEGLPLSLIEQQANGLQCVVSDTITTEVDKTGNLSWLSIKDSPSFWANKILSLNSHNNREERSIKAVKNIIASDFSIQNEAKKLQDFYFSIK